MDVINLLHDSDTQIRKSRRYEILFKNISSNKCISNTKANNLLKRRKEQTRHIRNDEKGVNEMTLRPYKKIEELEEEIEALEEELNNKDKVFYSILEQVRKGHAQNLSIAFKYYQIINDLAEIGLDIRDESEITDYFEELNKYRQSIKNEADLYSLLQ